MPLPPAELLSLVVGHRGTAKSLTSAAADTELVARFTAVLTGWCSTVEAVLAAGEAAIAGKDAEDAGATGQEGRWQGSLADNGMRHTQSACRSGVDLMAMACPEIFRARRSRVGDGALAVPHRAAARPGGAARGRGAPRRSGGVRCRRGARLCSLA